MPLLYFLLLSFGISSSLLGQCIQPLENGLIYQESTLQVLREAIDSIQAQELAAPSTSLSQGKGFYLSLEFKKKQAKKRQELAAQLEQLSPEEFLQNYPSTQKREVTTLAFSQIEEGDSLFYYCEYSSSPQLACMALAQQASTANQWVYQWKGHQLEAFYFPEALEPIIIPVAYEKALVYYNNLLQPTLPLLLPSTPANFYSSYRDLYRKEEELSQLSSIQQKELLQQVRGISIEISCGADESPCFHYLQLARLAALTGNPALFLKAHWEAIENYSSVHDLGYYLESEYPYYHSGARELDQLNINLVDLTVGFLLPTNQLSLSFYHNYKNILANILVHSKDRMAILEEVENLIKNPQLTLFHRQLAAYFYHDFLFALPKKKPLLIIGYTQLFKAAISTLPSPFQEEFKSFPSFPKPRKRKEIKATK